VPKFSRLISAVLKQTDYRRWTDPGSFSESWDERNRMIAQMISPRSRVLEFGAGTGRLASLLPDDCQYTGSDLVARNADTLVCDLNRRPIPVHGNFDVVIFSGVLEYLTDCPGVIAHTTGLCSQIIASYAVLRGPLIQSYWKRRNYGWLNDFSEDELIEIFARNRLKPVEKRDWQSQIVVRFEK